MSCTCDILTTTSIVGPLEGIDIVILTSSQDAVINLSILIFKVENVAIQLS